VDPAITRKLSRPGQPFPAWTLRRPTFTLARIAGQASGRSTKNRFSHSERVSARFCQIFELINADHLRGMVQVRRRKRPPRHHQNAAKSNPLFVDLDPHARPGTLPFDRRFAPSHARTEHTSSSQKKVRCSSSSHCCSTDHFSENFPVNLWYVIFEASHIHNRLEWFYA